MRPNATLVVTSLLSIVLLTLHVTDDIVRGISKAESSNTALLVLVVLLYGTLVLYERRSGHVIMLLVGFLAAAMEQPGGSAYLDAHTSRSEEDLPEDHNLTERDQPRPDVFLATK